MKRTIEPFICLNDAEGFKAWSEGYHTHGGEKLNVHTISIGYPVADWGKGEIRQFILGKPGAMTAEMLMHYISGIVTAEIAHGNNYAPHVAEDYCIERITVTDGVALVEIGS